MTTTEVAEVSPPEPNGDGPLLRLLDRAAILAASDIQSELVDVPEWGGSVMVRGLTGAERDAFERSLVEQRGKDIQMNWTNFRAKIVVRAVVGADGKRLFTDADAPALGAKSAAALDRIVPVAQRLSGMRDSDVKELTEGLKDGPSEGSGSD